MSRNGTFVRPGVMRVASPAVLRVALGCSVITGVCLAQLGTAIAAAPPAAASTRASAPFVAGTASASAQAINLAPTTGNLNYSVILATSAADYENDEGQALAQTLDLGTIGTILEAPSCTNGAPSSVKPSDFPLPVQAESTNGDQSLSANEADSVNGAGAGAGVETATATTQPTGSSTTTLTGENLAGLIDIGSSTSSANAALQNGDTRYASATADFSSISLAAGLVVLKGLHWVATQSSGASTTSTASFDISGLTIAGANVPLSNDSITTILKIINSTLTPIGLNVQWPEETTQSDGTVMISPLSIGIDNNELGQKTVGATILPDLETVREDIENAVVDLNCNGIDAFVLADIGIGPFAGGGNLNVELGGANAVTTDETFVSPFSTVSPPSVSTTVSPSSSGLPTTSFTPGTPGSAGTTGSALTSPASGSNSSAGAGKTQALGALSKFTTCHSLSPAGGGCNGADVALPVGLAGLALLGGLLAWDYQRQRRRSRLHEVEAS